MKGGYIVIDPGCKVTLYDPDDLNLPITLRILTDNGHVEQPLTTAMLRELGYHAALFFRQRTGKNCFLPADFKHPEPLPTDARHAPAEPVTPSPRVRVRTPPPAEPPAPTPTARIRVRSST